MLSPHPGLCRFSINETYVSRSQHSLQQSEFFPYPYQAGMTPARIQLASQVMTAIAAAAINAPEKPLTWSPEIEFRIAYRKATVRIRWVNAPRFQIKQPRRHGTGE
jgi:hypothetical protein